MKIKKELTQEQQQFVRENRLIMATSELAATLKVPFNRVRDFMQVNELILTNKEIDNIRRAKKLRNEKKELTQEQQQFVRENRLIMSTTKMATALKIPFNRVRNFMQVNELMLTNKELENIRRSKRNVLPKKIKNEVVQEQQPKPYFFDFWNHKLNPITMYRPLQYSNNK